MGLNFPVKAEVRLKKTPLSEVICQVKFPPILRISKETPANFQEAIRSRFPELEVEQGVLLQFGVSPALEKPLVETAPKVYRFKSMDKKSNVTLATDFFAFSTNGYTHWEDFLNDFTFIEKAVREEFYPPYTTRNGLRFINRFTRKNTGCKTFDELIDLFRDELTGLIRVDVWTEPNEMLIQIVLPDNQAKLLLRAGFGKEQKEPFFILDFDYFEDKQLDFKNLSGRIKKYHTKIYQAFRWCLKDSSLERFEPLTGK
jgi:uncharacterized protein (TIGR04255 family)